MKLKIGFQAETVIDTTTEDAVPQELLPTAEPRKSVVRVHFVDRDLTLSYYNDHFDLHQGDFVYVEGKLSGQLGCVVDVSYNFKIKLSDYKRVIAVADTNVKGQFFGAGSHFLTFDPAALPAQKAVTWFKAPQGEEDTFVSSTDGKPFSLADLSGMGVEEKIAQRGHDYYADGKVRYLSLNGSQGYALVEGSENYEVEFTYEQGEIRDLTCSCFCAYPCKHQFAAMLQLRECLQYMEEHYAQQFAQTGYFAAIHKQVLLIMTVLGKKTGGFTL